jgi:hypothetical protein
MAAPCGFSIWTEKLYDGQPPPHLTRLRRAGYDVSVIRRIFRSPRLLAGFLAVLLLPPSFSTLVWCHKPDGRAEVERENSPGECLCANCELCRERSSADPQAGLPSSPALTADHCHHEAAAAEAPSVLLESKTSQDTALSFGFPVLIETGLSLCGFDSHPRIFTNPQSSGPPDNPPFSFRC